MQYLALSYRLEGTTQESLTKLAREEAQVAWQLLTEGILRSVHLCPDRPGSVIVLECDSIDEARQALQRLPMVRDGLIAFEVSRMIAFTGWSALFSAEVSA